MRLATLIGILIVGMLTAACEDAIDTPGSADFESVVIVEGTVTDENKVQSVKLTMSSPVNHYGELLPAAGAVVTISDGAVMVPLVESVSGTGIYRTALPFRSVAGKVYTLSISHGGRTYVASDRMYSAGIADTITYSPVDPGLYEWNVPNNHTLQQGTTFEWHVEIIHPTGHSDSVTFYNFTGLETSALFALNQMSMGFRFPPGTRIIQQKRSLSPGFYEYLKAVYAESVWKGDLYAVTPANPPTNLSNGARGYFRVSAVTQTNQIVK